MRLRLGLCGLLLVATAAGQAHAYPFEAKTPPRAEPKSPGASLAWAAGSTAVGAAALFGGLATDLEMAGAFVGTPILIVGPALGRGRAGGAVAPGLLIRGVSGAIVIFTLKEKLPKCTDECGGKDPAYLEGEEKVVVYGAAAILMASAVYDTVRAPLDARDFNRAREIAVIPTVMPGGAGLALGGSF